MKQKHLEEVSELKNRLKWFAENQELLDRDAGRLRAAAEETLRLKEQVVKLKIEVTNRSGEQQKKTRVPSADAKRIQHLERQVKELEQVLRNRNPNSLPALILAAASARDPTSDLSRVAALLERRVQRLEAELEARDDEAWSSSFRPSGLYSSQVKELEQVLRNRNPNSLPALILAAAKTGPEAGGGAGGPRRRGLEQQFQAIRMRYEQRICELEQQLEQKRLSKPGPEPDPARGQGPVPVQSLSEELERERDAHRQKEAALQNQLDALQQQMKRKAHVSPGRHQLQTEAALGLRIERLNQELSTKSRTIQDLTRAVDRLQRERRGTETFPALSACDKTYQPTEFRVTHSHISEVQQENTALNLKLQRLQSDSAQERDELRTTLTQTLEQIHRLKEEHALQLSSAQAQSLRDQAQLRSAFALQHSGSAVAQLSNQLQAQQVLVQQLQEHLEEAQGWRRALNVSRGREEVLQAQLKEAREDLKEARGGQSPEVKLLWSLERKVLNMETRQQQRHRDLQQLQAVGAALPGGVALQVELEKWKCLAQNKSRELERFRLELDSILDIIRHLQKQGVVLPGPGPLQTALHTT
ncbi:centrosomal protein of 162 kDa-like [Eucyclogobius newberryi]|uniref:centrosomal protein of 162 kDa-like n=1 Tax=Eucyclogobius newberryi TaxID=166745 RepID=UPI003B59F176